MRVVLAWLLALGPIGLAASAGSATDCVPSDGPVAAQVPPPSPLDQPLVNGDFSVGAPEVDVQGWWPFLTRSMTGAAYWSFQPPAYYGADAGVMVVLDGTGPSLLVHNDGRQGAVAVRQAPPLDEWRFDAEGTLFLTYLLRAEDSPRAVWVTSVVESSKWPGEFGRTHLVPDDGRWYACTDAIPIEDDPAWPMNDGSSIQVGSVYERVRFEVRPAWDYYDQGEGRVLLDDIATEATPGALVLHAQACVGVGVGWWDPHMCVPVP